ncbi:MAG: nucleoside 2-deoxyribosyltransferase [Alphaproteobacteria bacterium]|nr:nucleoside 2-deoxyribosyltransferase [Alphaproteobacteria bacterium]
MLRIPEVHAYLAGPDVFYPKAKEIGEAKKAKLSEVGIFGHFPFDNTVDASDHSHKAAMSIGKGDEGMMLACCLPGRFGIILANMTPYRSPSMDVGTAFEVGFMSALAEIKDNILIIGYTDDPRPFEARVIDDYYGGKDNVTEQDGVLRGPDGMEIEAFGGAENLMLTHAIEKTGGSIVNSFEEAVALARRLADERIIVPDHMPLQQ